MENKIFETIEEIETSMSTINELTLGELRKLRQKLVRSKRKIKDNEILKHINILNNKIKSK